MENYLQNFKNPPAEFRGKPFWAWNCKLDKEELLKQISYFKEMGMGGATLHCRTGLATEYLGEEFFETMEAVAAELKREGMLTGLYDEDRWPSGFAGGKVTEKDTYRKRFLVFSPWRKEEHEERMRDVKGDKSFWERSAGCGTLLARYEVKLRDGYLASCRRLSEGETATDGEEWYAYLELAAPNPKFNGKTYVDTLNKKALEQFLAITHEEYAKHFGAEFGKSIPSIFSDEPQFTFKQFFGTAEEKRELLIPYTDDFEDTFCEKYGESFLAHLPEVFWELPDGEVSVIRYEYHEHVTERFVEAFADTIGAWCREHRLAFTGHMMEEPTLYSQTSCTGETMRNYRGFGIPGIDILCDKREYTTAKQAQSAVQQMGKNQMMCEIYGVTNWDFDFRGHKSEGDYLAALGVTERVHHLAWASMAGESKRDYPASIFYQSPWYREYSELETYYARLNTALRSGSPVVRIGVIHPVESYWMVYGPEAQTADIREKLEKQFREITEWLLFSLLDFHYISEGLLESLDKEPSLVKRDALTEDRASGAEALSGKAAASAEDGASSAEALSGKAAGDLEDAERDATFAVGTMRYDCVIVPGCLTLREHTLERLAAFAAAGGKVIFLGDVPELVAGRKDERPAALAERTVRLPFDRNRLLGELEAYRMIDLKNANGVRTDRYVYQMRRTEGETLLFLANAKKIEKPDIPVRWDGVLTLRGIYQVTNMDALTGDETVLAPAYRDGNTYLPVGLYEYDSLLLRLRETEAAAETEQRRESMAFGADGARRRAAADFGIVQAGGREKQRELTAILHEVTDYSMEEENVLVLDQAEYALDGEAYQPAEELLRIDKKLRERVSYPLRTGISVQPWARGQEAEHVVEQNCSGQQAEHVEEQKCSGQQAENVEEQKAALHTVRLRFVVESEADISDCKLVLEELSQARVFWDGTEKDTEQCGFFVDHHIPCMKLGAVERGTHIFEVEHLFTPETKVEWLYLTGDFGVKVFGNRAILTSAPERVAYGSLTEYGFPFYGGNFTYQHEIEVKEDGDYEIEITKFRAPLLKICVDGTAAGRIMFAPYRCSLGRLAAGKHRIGITSFGSRINTFGQIHNNDDAFGYYGPDSWRTEGASYSYEYQLWKTGILSAPQVFRITGED